MKLAVLLFTAGAVGCARDEAVGGGGSSAVPASMAPAPMAKVAPPKPAALTHVTIKALGMYCEESCPIRVRMALADIPSVYELGFDLAHESVFISYDRSLGAPKSVTKPMLTAIKDAGFDPWLAKELWPSDAVAQVVKR